MSNLKNTLVFYFILILCISFTINTSKSVVRLRNAAKEKAIKERELQALINDNEDLRKKLITLDSVTMEALVRDKLSMAKEGETMIILPEDMQRMLSKAEEPKITELPDYANWQKWLQLFSNKI